MLLLINNINMSGFSLTTFADDGQLKQVNNALAAANNGETAIAVKTKDGIILAVEKNIQSILEDETSFSKIVPMSRFIEQHILV